MTSPTPRLRLPRWGAIGLALCAGLGTLTACTSDALNPADRQPQAYRLVAFDSCDDALGQLRAATRQAVGPYGLNQGYATADSAGGIMKAAPVPQAATGNAASSADQAASPPAYSGTNTQETGVDEPDLVKTDGRRIVIVHNGVMQVIDAASHSIAGTVDLTTAGGDPVGYGQPDLLLAGDHALVLIGGGYPMTYGGPVGAAVDPPAAGAGFGGSGATDDAVTGAGTKAVPALIGGPQLILVDLAGTPKVLSRLAVDGTLLDARQTGSVARVVISSSPRISFPNLPSGTDTQRTKVNQSIIDQATLDKWLPRIDVTTGSTTTHVQIDCNAVSRPNVYSGTSMLTVLSLDLAGASLADPQPVSLLADGQTVYSNGASLYVATDQRWRAPIASSQPDSGTTVYRFDTSKPGRPTFVAGGSVPGFLINQYAMSDRNGYLRIATTSGNSNWESDSAVTSQSGVYVLHPDGGQLVRVGQVEGLGQGEKIYAVRFLDDTAYVVTFKQTDPLYTVDLSDPTRPTVRGELKITGYSSYLHPIEGGKLIGIGQDVNARVQADGTQVSLFDVSNLDSPSRLGLYQLAGTNSEAEFDPHAFLYWPATGLLVIPMSSNQYTDVSGQPAGALVLRISGSSISRVGLLTQPTSNGMQYDPIRRSLIIGSTLWTVSDGGLMASDLTTLERTAWIALG